MQFENVQLELEGRIALLTVNRPKALNALNLATLKEIHAAIERVAGAADVLIITGGGPKSFVAGADIGEMKEMSEEQALEFARLGQGAFWRLRAMSIPTIAAVNGFALGGGCELAIACDIILAADNAKFGQPEVNLGVIPGFGGTQRLSRLVGPQWAKYLIYSGEMIGAEEAARIGLALRVVPAAELMVEARKLASTIAGKGMAAVRLSKEVIDQGMDVGLEAGLELEARGFARCFTTADQREGMDAFLGKRKPAFTGR
jgi:enoyl-CoA hydratase